MFKIIGTISGLTLISRVLGFIRDVFIANFLGAGFLTDCFVAAFRLPNLFRRIFAEGALSAAFIPIYTGKLSEDKEKSTVFAQEVFSVLIVALIVLTVVAEIFMPYIVKAIAVGFDAEKVRITTQIARITFPYLIFISLVALFGGILNSLHKFAAFAAAPIILNLCLIASFFVFGEITPTYAHSLALGAFVAGILQFAWVYFYARRSGICITPKMPKITNDIRKLFSRMFPVIIGGSVAQLNLVIDTILASTFAGGVSYLHFAERLFQLPIGVIGVAIGTAILPMLSRHVGNGDKEKYTATQNKALELGLFFALPAMVGLMLLAEPIITVLFEHGKFTAVETMKAFPALIAYSTGLPAIILVKIFLPSFFANHDTKTPVKIGVFCLVLNVVLNLILMQFYAHVGLAIATAITSWINAILMGMALKKRGLLSVHTTTFRRIAKFVFATIVMSVAVWLTSIYLTDFSKIVLLVGSVAIGGTVFIGLVFALDRGVFRK